MLRRRALLSDFQTREYQGGQFKGVGITNQPQGMEERIGGLLHSRIKIAGSLFRTGMIGNPPSTYIHADPNHAEYAGVLYLNLPEQCRGGTAFWKHRALNLSEMPMDRPPEFYDNLLVDGQDESKWEMIGLVGMKFNRFIVYPTKQFHSQYPQPCWGDSVESGRLIWTTFFDIA